MPRTIKTIVILKPKSATAGFETGTVGMQNESFMSDCLPITPRIYSPKIDLFGVHILGGTLYREKTMFYFLSIYYFIYNNIWAGI